MQTRVTPPSRGHCLTLHPVCAGLFVYILEVLQGGIAQKQDKGLSWDFFQLSWLNLALTRLHEWRLN